MPRKPAYFLLDTSASMQGKPLQDAQALISATVAALRQDPHALEHVSLGLIGFHQEAQVLVPLTELLDFALPPVIPLQPGPAMTGRGLELLCQLLDQDIRPSTDWQRGDHPPLLSIITNSPAADSLHFQAMLPEVRRRPIGAFLGCLAGSHTSAYELRQFCDHVLTLQAMDGATFARFFTWALRPLTRTVGGTDQLAGVLPAPADFHRHLAL